MLPMNTFFSFLQLGRILMVFNGPLFFFRVFRVYHASWKLGPKLIIIHRMVICIPIELQIEFVTIKNLANIIDKFYIYFSNLIQIPEIIIFVALLVIFIIAYGVANQAIIDPYRDLEWKNIGPLLYDILVLPYWQMYGDLQLET